MWKKRLNTAAKLAWVGLLAGGVAYFAAQQRGTPDAPPRFRTLTPDEAARAWEGGQVLGHAEDTEADVVVFSRYTCPFSQALFFRLDSLALGGDRQPTVRIRHLVHPMDSVSYRAALGMVCADLQGRSGEFHDALLRDTSQKHVGDLVSIAARTGIGDLPSFQTCLASEEAVGSVDTDLQDGLELGITGVPALVAGDRLVVGSVSETELREWLR